MLWLQEKWVGRVLAAVLIASMLPTVVVARAPTTGGPHFGTFERWIRAQLRISDGAVEKAIAVAVAEEADSVREFVATFLKTYEDVAPGHAIALVFTERELSTDALVSYLQSRYTRVVDYAVLPRIFLTNAANHTATNGQAGTSSGINTADQTARLTPNIISIPLFGAFIIIPLRALSSAHPLGP